MKKAIIWIIIIVLVLIGVFFYETRPVAAPSDVATSTSETGTTGTTGSVTTAPKGTTGFSVVPSQSFARFEIDEVLNGKTNHVVGTSTDVSGEVFVDPNDLSLSKATQIKVNARALHTDSAQRDGALGRFILKSEDHQYITFDVSGISAVPSDPVIGKDYMFKVTGDLTIAGETHEETFDVTAGADSTSKIHGIAKTTINYKDFNIMIPSVPFVANVSNTVALTFSFVLEK